MFNLFKWITNALKINEEYHKWVQNYLNNQLQQSESSKILPNKITHIEMQNLGHHLRRDGTGGCDGERASNLKVIEHISLCVISVNYT